MPATLDELENALRRTVEDCRFTEVEAAARELCHAGTKHLALLEPDDPRRGIIATHIMETLNWAILMMIAGKSCCLQELNRVLVAGRYLQQPEEDAERLPLDA